MRDGHDSITQLNLIFKPFGRDGRRKVVDSFGISWQINSGTDHNWAQPKPTGTGKTVEQAMRASAEEIIRRVFGLQSQIDSMETWQTGGVVPDLNNGAYEATLKLRNRATIVINGHVEPMAKGLVGFWAADGRVQER